MYNTKNLISVLTAFTFVTMVFVASSANATIIQFDSSPDTAFADGTFSTNLSGLHSDGFYQTSNTSAYNGYGQNGEYVLFNGPVLLNSLDLSNFGNNWDATTITASLFNGASLLASQTINPSDSYQTLIFDTVGVTKLQFDFTGGSDVYSDGRIVAWYEVGNITYNVASVPAPQIVWLIGIGLGLIRLVKRKKV